MTNTLYKAGLSGVPDKSSSGRGRMSRYSAQTVICFTAYIFQFSIPLWVGLGILCFRAASADSALCPLWSEGSHYRQSNLPASFVWTDEVLWYETLSGTYAVKLAKLTDTVHKICISGKLFNARTMLVESFCFIPVSNFIVFHPRIQTDFNSLKLGQLRLFWWIFGSRIWQLSLSCQT